MRKKIQQQSSESCTKRTAPPGVQALCLLKGSSNTSVLLARDEGKGWGETDWHEPCRYGALAEVKQLLLVAVLTAAWFGNSYAILILLISQTGGSECSNVWSVSIQTCGVTQWEIWFGQLSYPCRNDKEWCFTSCRYWSGDWHRRKSLHFSLPTLPRSFRTLFFSPLS